MPLSVSLTVDHDASPHQYRVYDPSPDSQWLEELAQEYVRLRAGAAGPLEPIVLDGIEVLDSAGLAERIRNATIPDRSTGNFSVVRSDFGEVVSYLLLEQVCSARMGYKSVRDRELIRLPGRGIDAVAIESSEGDQLTLILAETKTSNAGDSPPSVVDSASDSLRHQHLHHLGAGDDSTSIGYTARKIWDIARRIVDVDTRRDFMLAAYLFEERRWDRLSLAVACFLIRPSAHCTDADFGSFRMTPDDYQPADVRFYIFRTPDDIESTIDEWHRLASNSEVDN